MKKTVSVMVALASLATPALAQIRPQDCAPVFPVVDQVAAEVIPQDVTAVQAGPAPVARRGFFGLPFLPLLLAAGGIGGIIALSGGHDHSHTVSPA